MHFLLAALTLSAMTTIQASPLATPDLPDLVEKTLPGVVNVSSTSVINYRVFGMDNFLQNWGIPQERKQSSLGSGFIIDHDGFIITNNHVVEQASEVVVTLFDKRQFKAKIIGTDKKMDLALLQILPTDPTKPLTDLKSVPTGDSDKVRIGEAAFAVGNPFGLQHTVTLGIISAKNRTIGQGPFDNFLQTDASINPGNSGGPLFNIKGEVIGINTVIFSRTGQSGGLGFAIPVNEATAILADLKKYGRVPRPWLGILSQQNSAQFERYYHLATSKGVIIHNLVEGGPADEGGLKPGDILLDMDGKEITEPYDIERALARHRPKEAATFKLMRGKKQMELKFKLDELPRRDDIPQGII